MGKSYLAQFPSCPLHWPHRARKGFRGLASGYWASSQVSRGYSDRHRILLISLGHRDHEAPALSRKHLNLSGPQVWSAPATLSMLSWKKLRDTCQDHFSHIDHVLLLARPLSAKDSSYKPRVNLPSPQQMIHECSVSRPQARVSLVSISPTWKSTHLSCDSCRI